MDFFEDIEETINKELDLFLFDDQIRAPTPIVTAQTEDDELEFTVPVLPPSTAAWDDGLSAHYRSTKWLNGNQCHVVLGGGGPYLRIMSGTSFVKYIGSCTGGVRVRRDSLIIDRSNNFYYLGAGIMRSDVEHDRFRHLAMEFERILTNKRFIWLHHKFDLIPVKFCQLGSMYNYVLVYSIRLSLPLCCSRLIGDMLGYGTAFYSRSCNRFFKLGDHHSAGKVSKMSYKNVEMFLVFSRRDFVEQLKMEFLPNGDGGHWVWELIRSMVSAAADFIHLSGACMIGLVDGLDVHCCIMVTGDGLPDEINGLCLSYLGGPGASLLDGRICRILVSPPSPSVDSRFSLVVHRSWTEAPELINGFLV